MKRFAWVWMLPILLLSTALSSIHLNDDAIWFDEWITYFISGTGDFAAPQLAGTPCAEFAAAGTPPLDTLCLAAIDNSWPPAFFLLMKGWDFVSGGVTFTDRVLALLIGLLAVSVMYQLGKSLFSRDVGLMSAALLGSCAFMLFYMHEVRGYTLYVLMPALAGWFYWLMLTSRYYTRRWLRWAFVFAVAVTLYTHYIGLAVVFGIGAYHIFLEAPRTRIITGERRDGSITPHRWTSILKLGINGCLLYAPWIAVLIVSFINESITQRSLDTFTLMRGMVYGFSNNLWWIALPLIGLTVIQWRNRAVRFLWVWALAILAVSIAGNIFANFLFHPRHIMGMLPAFMLLITATLMWLLTRQRLVAWLIVALWVGAGIFAARNDDFMNALPRHISTVPLASMTTMVDTANQCAADDTLMILSIDGAQDEWVHDQPLGYYLSDTGMDFVQLGSLVTDDGDNNSVLLPRDLYADDYASRVATMTTDVEHVYLMSLTSVENATNIAALEGYLSDDGFASCGAFVSDDDLQGTGYSRDCSQICTP